MSRTFNEQFLAARRTSTPLLAVRTPDPAATMSGIRKLYEDSGRLKDIPLVVWDMGRGLTALNPAGEQAGSRMVGGPEQMTMARNFSEMLEKALTELPANSILFVMNAQNAFGRDADPGNAQCVWNLREPFKGNRRTLLMLCPDITLPPELAEDVIVLDEPYPNDSELSEIVQNTYADAKLEAPKPETVKQCIAALRGLARFPADQISAMSITKNGMDIDNLYERKFQRVDQTPGLKVYRGKDNFPMIGGCANFKKFMNGYFNGNEPADFVIFMDELEKMFAGIAGDLSGVSQGQHEEFLKFTQDNDIDAVMLVGIGGSAKSACAKALGGEFSRPVISYSVSAAQNSLVGSSGQRTREAHKQLLAMGKPLIVATSNNINGLPPELKRRFQFSTFFFDLPTLENRAAIWPIYLNLWNLWGSVRPGTALPKAGQHFNVDDTDWTGAEIRSCCKIAYKLRCSLPDAAKYIVPIAKSSPNVVKGLREQANNTYISADYEGPYLMAGKTTESAPVSRRVISTKGGVA